MLWLLIVIVLAAHLLAVNVASAGPMVCLWLEWREGRGDLLAGRAGRALTTASLVLFIVGMLLGLVVGWLHWSERYAATLAMLRSKVFFGVWELVFSLVLMGLHVAWWRWQPIPSGWKRGLRMLLPFLAGTNLLYHFTFLFAILADFDTAGEVPETVITAAAFRALMVEPAVYTRVIHFVLAAFAVTGVTVMAWAAWRVDVHNDQKVRRAMIWGSRIALVPTLLQIPVGIWFMSQLPPVALQRLMGGDLLGTMFFGLSLLLAFGLMQKLADVALGDTATRLTWLCALLMIAIVTLMTGTLERALPSAGWDQPVSRVAFRSAKVAHHQTNGDIIGSNAWGATFAERRLSCSRRVEVWRQSTARGPKLASWIAGLTSNEASTSAKRRVNWFW